MATLKNRSWRRGGAVWVLLCVLALVWASAPALAQAQPLTGTFAGTSRGRTVDFSHGGKARSNWAGVLRLKLDNGPEIPVFCIQIDVHVSNGDRYHSDGPVLALPNGCQIRYLLDHYPASSARDANEAAARQLAIWVFSDQLDPSTIKDAAIRDRTIALVNDTKGKPCPLRRTEAPDLAIQPPAASAAAGQVVAYTISAGQNDAGSAVTVSVDGPAVISDASGTNSGQQQQQVTLNDQGSATIWVLSTGAGQTSVRATLPYVLESGTVFSQIDDSRPTQRLVMAERQNFEAHAAAQANWSAGAPPAPTGTLAPATATPGGPGGPTATPAPAPETPTAPAPTSVATATRGPDNSDTPTPGDQGGATATPAEQGGATATPAGSEATPADVTPADVTPADVTPSEAPPADVSPAQTAVAGAEAGAPTAGPLEGQQGMAPGNQAAGATGNRPPAVLPRTGAPAGPPTGALLAGVLALLLGGWALRRRGHR
jgi:hypothetical protein